MTLKRMFLDKFTRKLTLNDVDFLKLILFFHHHSKLIVLYYISENLFQYLWKFFLNVSNPILQKPIGC